MGCLVVGFVYAAYGMYSKNWIANDVLAEAFSFTAVKLLTLDSFKTGMILLAGCFFYDVFLGIWDRSHGQCR